MKDYYEILEVPIDATQEQIKEQYRLLAHAWHPDKFATSDQKISAEEKLKDINEAYDVLSNPSKRAKYDESQVSDTSSGRTDDKPDNAPVQRSTSVSTTVITNHESDIAETADFDQPRYWLMWVLATAGGWLLGSLGNFAVSIVLSMTGLSAALNADPAQIDQGTLLFFMGVSLVMLLIVGLAVGALQWLVLRRHLPAISRWALFTGLGFALGSFVFLAFMGVGVGLTQWLLLRRELNKTVWWPVINAVAWPAGYMLGGSLGAALGSAINVQLVGGLLGAALTGAIIGVVTGAVLLWMLRQNRALLDGLRQEVEEAKP